MYAPQYGVRCKRRRVRNPFSAPLYRARVLSRKRTIRVRVKLRVAGFSVRARSLRALPANARMVHAHKAMVHVRLDGLTWHKPKGLAPAHARYQAILTTGIARVPSRRMRKNGTRVTMWRGGDLVGGLHVVRLAPYVLPARSVITDYPSPKSSV